MSKLIDRSGQKFNSWTIIDTFGKDKRNNWLWNCICDCGKKEVKTINLIVTGKSKQCVDCQAKSLSIPIYEHELPNSIWNKTVLQAKRRVLEFNINKEYAYKLFIEQNKKCKLSNLELQFAKNPKDYRALLQTASLDRIDSSKGYIEGNVQWIHKKVNLMKNILEEKEFIEICKLIARNNE